MEPVFVLMLLAILSVPLVALVLAVIALSGGSRLRREVERLREDVGRLESRLAALAGLERRESSSPVVPEEAAPRPLPAAAVPPVAPAAPPPTPKPPGPQVQPSTTSRAAPPAVAARAATHPPAPGEPGHRTPVPPGPPSQPPPPAGPAFDWESLLGLKGAAWLGGIAIVVAGMFLVKLAIDAGVFTPPLRVAVLTLAGIGSLVWAEVSLRRGYATTANAVCGAGIALLYVAFYAAHALYGLLGVSVTFALMALVTTVAGLLSVRYDALATAGLGLLGGFATPVVLSTGVDRPIGFFSYLLLLNVGLAAVALRQRWHGLVLLAVAGTFALELSWFARFMAPEKMLVGVVAFLVFGVLYLLLPLQAKDAAPGLTWAGMLGGTAPFLFAALIAGSPRYATEWPLLFLFVALLDAALVLVGLLSRRVGLALAAAMATAITLPLWAASSLGRPALWGPVLSALAVTALLNAARRLAALLAPDVEQESRTLLETTGLLSAAGLGLLALVLVARGLGEPPWAFLVLLAGLLALLLERTRRGRLSGALLLGTLALAGLVQAWFAQATRGDLLLRNLVVPQLLTLALSIAAVRRSEEKRASEDEAAVVIAGGVAVAGLVGCLVRPGLGGDPLPLFASLVASMVLLVLCALRTDWTALLPAGLLASAGFALLWETLYFHPTDLPVVGSVDAALYVGFLGLPFAVPAAVGQRWRPRPWPWAASALAGPVFFYPLYLAITRGWGRAWIGALPVVLAALSLLALRGVALRFAPAPETTLAGRARLRWLALFAVVTLGFVAVAIPLQLERQWITVGWALEAMAVFWLFGILRHPGLRLFGGALFAAVGVRLLLNPEVLRYEERGLPILNWLLYTYGVPAACCFLGAAALRRADQARPSGSGSGALASAVAGLGLLLVFALINLEIADFFSAGRYLEFALERRLARDLAMSVAWGVYALTLLVLGVWRRSPVLRYVSLGFLVLTVVKVFLYDLSNLSGLYRILSFLGLGVSLILVSLLYQRFVVPRERAR